MLSLAATDRSRQVFMTRLFRDAGPRFWKALLTGGALLLCLGFLPVSLGGQAADTTQPSAPPPPASAAQAPSVEMAVKDETITPKSDEAATFRVNVRLVLARVVVRDSSGHAVGNLHKEDFELLDNGKPQVISHFDVEHLSNQTAEAPATTKSPNAADGSTPSAAPPAIPTRFVAYLFDDLHLDFENINLVRAAAERRIDSLAPTDRIAIFSTSGQTTLDFTDDRKQLRHVLDTLIPRPTLGGETLKCPDISLYMADLIVNKNDPEVLQAAANDPCGHGGISFARAAATQVLVVGEEDSRRALGVVKDAVRRITSMPGQRNLILISPGFLTPELEYDYNDVIDRAVRGQVIISTLDARGLYVSIPFGDASQRGHVDVDVPGQAFTPASRAELDRQAASAQNEIMAVLAYSTGGSFFHNNNDMDEGFRRVADSPEHCYVLGFTPLNLKTDGKFHSLKVVLKVHEKYELQARHGYYAPNHKADAAEEAKREIEDELLSSEELHDLPVAVHTQFFKASDDTAKLTVLARVDVRRLHYKQTDGRNENDLTVVTAVFDRNGNYLQSNQKVVQMRWKNETLQSRLAAGITLRTSFDVKPGQYVVRVVARDTEQQMMSAENGAVEIP